MHTLYLFLSVPVKLSNEAEHPWINLIGILCLIGLIFLLLFWQLLKYGRRVADAKHIRAAAEAICVWTFSPDEWQEYAADSGFIKDSKGPGEIKITVYDIWIKDENGIRCQSLNAKRLVTDCRVDSRGIKIRRRWVVDTQESSATYHVDDLHILVPPGKADDAAKIVDTLKTFIADHSHLVARVIPPDAIYSLMGEIDF